MRRPGLSSYAVGLLLIGTILTCVGVGFQFGAPWGLMLCGVALTMGGVVLVRDLLRAPRSTPARPAFATPRRPLSDEPRRTG